MVGQTHSDQDSLVLEVTVSDGELVRERHDDREYVGSVIKSMKE